MMERKARHGQPCTSCGLCCHMELCDLACCIFDKPKRTPGPCPALESDNGNSRCGMMTNPTKYSARAVAVGDDVARRAAALMIGPGEGCDMMMSNRGDVDHEYAYRRDLQDLARSALLRWAHRVWNMRPWAIKNGIWLKGTEPEFPPPKSPF